MRSIFLLLCVHGVAADGSNHCNTNDADGHVLLQSRSAVRLHHAKSEHLNAETTAATLHHVTSENLDAKATADTIAEVAELEQSTAETPAERSSAKIMEVPESTDSEGPQWTRLHREGLCPNTHINFGQRKSRVDDVAACAAVCQASQLYPMQGLTQSGCQYFAFDRNELADDDRRDNCYVYIDCPSYSAQHVETRWATEDSCNLNLFGATWGGSSRLCLNYRDPSQCECQDTRFDAYELLEPGAEVPAPSSETLQERYVREVSELEEYMCSQDRDTGGTCSFLGCWGWRGETECVASRCVCGPGQCSNDEGVCVPPVDYHTQRCQGLSQWNYDRDFVCQTKATTAITTTTTTTTLAPYTGALFTYEGYDNGDCEGAPIHESSGGLDFLYEHVPIHNAVMDCIGNCCTGAATQNGVTQYMSVQYDGCRSSIFMKSTCTFPADISGLPHHTSCMTRSCLGGHASCKTVCEEQ